MGILANKTSAQIEPFVPFDKPFASGKFFAMTKEPFLVGKLKPFKNDNGAFEDFIAKPTMYIHVRIPGVRAVFVQAGFAERPSRIIKDHEIEAGLAEMAKWYLEKHLRQSRALYNRVKLK